MGFWSGLKEIFLDDEEYWKNYYKTPEGRIYSWKKQIWDIMYPEDKKSFAYEKRLKERYTKNYNSYYSVDDMSLDDLIEFCDRNHIPINSITDEINKQKRIEFATNEEYDEKFKKVANFIEEFEPSQDYLFELPYHAELIGWLRAKFPEAVAEKQLGSSRPDIVIDEIAIEVKGPTTEQDLQTIADKCLRYSQHFKQGLIIVLFNVSVNRQRYKEWSEGLKQTHPQIIVIKK